MKFHNNYLTLSILLSGSLSTTAFAQSPQIDEIIVTAEKREQSLREVPISIVAFDVEKLEQAGIDEIEDLGANIPNLFVNNFNSEASTIRLFIRGVGQNDVSVTQDPSVGLYMDGVYVGSGIGAGSELVDLERIEVLRGPQGTLYGRNTTGGAVNMITAKPVPGEFHSKVDFTAGNFDRLKLRGNVNIPLGDTAAIKLSALKSERDGVVRNLGPGADFGEEDRVAYRGDLRWNIQNNITLDYAYENSDIEDSPRFSQPLRGLGADGDFGAPVSDAFGNLLIIQAGSLTLQPVLSTFYTEPFSESRQRETFAARAVMSNNTEIEAHTLTLAWEPNDKLTLKSITGLRDVQSLQVGEFGATGTAFTDVLLINDAAGCPLVTGPFDSRDDVIDCALIEAADGLPTTLQSSETMIEQLSQEINAVYDYDFQSGGNLVFVGGVYYYEDDLSQDTSPSAQTQAPLPPGSVFTTAENTSLAIYGQATYTPNAFDQRLHLTVGGRYSDDKRQATRINERSLSFARVGGLSEVACDSLGDILQLAAITGDMQAAVDIAACAAGDFGVNTAAEYDQDFSNFTPSFTVGYDVSDEVNIYGKYVQGYKSGGTSVRSANPINFANGFDEEDVRSFEAGLKGLFFDRRVAFNAAAFFMKFDGYQASVQTGDNQGLRDFVGIDDSEILGIEADFQAAITEELTLNGAVGFLHTQFGVDSVDVLQDTGQVATFDIVDNFSFAPDYSFSLSGNYRVDISDDVDANFYAGYSYQDDLETSSNLADNAIIDGYGLLDANLTFTSRRLGDDGTIKLSLWGKNLLDKEYLVVSQISFADNFGIDELAEFGDSRTYGLTLTWQR